MKKPHAFTFTQTFFFILSLSLSLSYSFIIHTLTIVLRFKSMFFWYRYVPKLNITFRQKSIKIQIKLQRKKINSLSHGWPIYFVQKYCLSFSMYCLLIQIIIYVSLFFKAYDIFLCLRGRQMQKAENIYTLVNLFLLFFFFLLLLFFCDARWLFILYKCQ